MPEFKANFKETKATSLKVTDTAEIAKLQVQELSGNGAYKDVLFDPGADFSDPSNYSDNYIPTLKQVVQFISVQNKASLQIYDLSTTATIDSGVTTIRANMSLATSDPGSGIFFMPQLNPSASQTGYFTTADIVPSNNMGYNQNKLTPQSAEAGSSNLKPYYLSNVTIASKKSLTVYNQGTLNLAYNSSSTSWTVTVSADGNTITFS